jgi:two-component system, OmpR family, response regulator QseB
VNLLLVEDEPGIATPLRRALEAEGHAVRWAADLERAREALSEAEPDLIVLDVMLPGVEDAGFVLASEVRTAGFKGGILFMTARDALPDRVRGLDAGGDDYVIKPFELLEFLARVRALLRRNTEARSSVLRFSRLEVDLVLHSVRVDGERVDLSAREFGLLERFALSPSRVYSAEELVDLVWGAEASSVGVVKVYVHHLRQKLGADAILTEGRGYRLGLEAGDAPAVRLLRIP